MRKVLTLVLFLLFLLWGCATLKNGEQERRQGSEERAEKPVSPPATSDAATQPTSTATSGNSQPVTPQSVRKEFHSEPATAQIRLVQLRLKAAGYDPGPIDGLFGPRTKTALRKYQESHGLSRNGGLDEKTLKALGVE